MLVLLEHVYILWAQVVQARKTKFVLSFSKDCESFTVY